MLLRFYNDVRECTYIGTILIGDCQLEVVMGDDLQL